MTILEAKRTIVHGIGQAKLYGRLLVVMATGTGKSFLAMQITWKLQRAGFVDAPKPRLLYLADRNVLIDRSGNRESTSAFGENAIEHTDLTEADQFDPLVHPAWTNLGLALRACPACAIRSSPFFESLSPSACVVLDKHAVHEPDELSVV